MEGGTWGAGQSQTLPVLTATHVPLWLQDCDGNLRKELDIGTGEMAQPFGSQHPL